MLEIAQEQQQLPDRQLSEHVERQAIVPPAWIRKRRPKKNVTRINSE